jgi:hypothetical protein
MAVPRLAERPFVDPSGRRKELVGGACPLVRGHETGRGSVQIGNSGLGDEEIPPVKGYETGSRPMS